MKENIQNGSCKEIELIDILLKLERHSSTNAPSNIIKQDIKEYKLLRKVCETRGVNVEKYDSSLYRLSLPLK